VRCIGGQHFFPCRPAPRNGSWGHLRLAFVEACSVDLDWESSANHLRDPYPAKTRADDPNFFAEYWRTHFNRSGNGGRIEVFSRVDAR
jgi:hypothetical protein